MNKEIKQSHVWKSPDLSTCEICGDKDWMADQYCSGKPKILDETEIPLPEPCKLCRECDGSCW